MLFLEMGRRMRRQWAATKARDLGKGGLLVATRASGLCLPRSHRASFRLVPRFFLEIFFIGHCGIVWRS